MHAIKKTALFLALTAAAATAAQAQTVTVYGTADVGYSNISLDGNKVNQIHSGGLSDSFIGLKASEDLGNGLKAGLTLEGTLGMDTGATGAGQLFNRESSVSLSMGASTLKLGRLPSLAYGTVKQFDVFGGGNLGFARGAFDTAGEYSNNTVGYGFSHGALNVGLTHSMGEQVNGGLTDGSVTAVTAGYTAGALSGAVTYTDSRAQGRTTLVGAGYDLGMAKVTGLFQKGSGASTLDNSYVFGVSAPVSTFKLMASAGRQKMIDGATTDLYSIGGQYDLSKRTATYASVGHLSADVNGNQFAIGVNHKF